MKDKYGLINEKMRKKAVKIFDERMRQLKIPTNNLTKLEMKFFSKEMARRFRIKKTDAIRILKASRR